MLDRATVIQHGIAIGPDCNALATVDPVDLPGDSILMSPHWVELLLEECAMPVKAEIREPLDFSGVIGTNLLQGRRMTIDVLTNEAVTIDWIPSSPNRFYEYPSLSGKLPWIDVTIKDREGRCQTISANVDTGNSEELTLPPSCVKELGLRLLNKCWVKTINGPVNASCGEVEIVWQGCHRTAKCIEREDMDRAIIGMSLLSGKRITIDFELSGASLRIAPIPRSAMSNKNFLQSFAEYLRRRFAGRS